MPMNILDHPVIRNCERTGYPDGKAPEYPICPVCLYECSNVYKNNFGDIIGCDTCITMHDAWEEPECYPDRNYD